jgi:hypothetical protein
MPLETLYTRFDYNSLINEGTYKLTPLLYYCLNYFLNKLNENKY